MLPKRLTDSGKRTRRVFAPHALTVLAQAFHISLRRAHSAIGAPQVKDSASLRFSSVSRSDQAGLVKLQVIHVGRDRVRDHPGVRIRPQQIVRLVHAG